MIKVKNLFAPVEPDDGTRMWVESVGLTRDLQEWCKVDLIAGQLAPSKRLSEWLENHPEGYDYFRANYHVALRKSRFFPTLEKLARTARVENITLLHTSNDTRANSALALQELISEVQSTLSPDV